MALFGHGVRAARCPFVGVERTSRRRVPKSGNDSNWTLALISILGQVGAICRSTALSQSARLHSCKRVLRGKLATARVYKGIRSLGLNVAKSINGLG